MTKKSISTPYRRVAAWRPALRRFLSCEDGATTTEFVLAAAVAVSLSVNLVLTTRDGAEVTAENTVVAMGEQSSEIDRLSDRQRAAMEEFSNYKEGMARASEGGQVDDPYSDYGSAPAGGAGDAAGTDREASEAGDSAESAETGQSSEETATQEAAAESGETDTGSEATQTAASEEAATGSGGSGGGANRDDDDDDDDDDETEVAQVEPEPKKQKKCTKKRRKKGKC